ncbi:MAG: 3-isopropylmalate dehydrogenase [Rhodobacteraceae bacterium]|nr:3-isopropylmalate dehydrogenase [Paracoccaceae bacterium]
MAEFRILALGGDGIGPEVLASGLKVARAAARLHAIRLSVSHDLLHGAAWDRWETFCQDETVAAAHAADAVLVGAVGGPAWDDIRVAGGPERQDGLMRLRRELDTFIGLRPAWHWPQLGDHAPIKRELANAADLLILREMCGGIMFAQPRGQTRKDGMRVGFDTAAYNEREVRRFACAGFELARARRSLLVSADKANVLESSKLWREIVSEIGLEYPDVELRHMYADNCAYQMVMNPRQFDVIIGCNLIGDILSDVAGSISGALGLLPSACLGARRCGRFKGIFEPVHGSAPDIAGMGAANPVGMVLSVAMMFEYGMCRRDVAQRIRLATVRAMENGARTPDIGGESATKDVTEAIVSELG